MEGPDVDALVAQLEALVDLVESLDDDDFRAPTRCPGWTVAELVAHCEGMLIRLVGENATPVDREPETDRVGYYRYDPQGPRDGDDSGRTFSEVVRDRVIDEVGGRSAEQLRSALDQAVRDAVDGVAELPAARVIHRSGHLPMTYGEFVASRNVEFAVHTMDLAHAAGRPELPVPASAAVVVEILDALLGAPLPTGPGWDAVTYILVATGRRPLTASERAALGGLADRFPLLA